MRVGLVDRDSCFVVSESECSIAVVVVHWGGYDMSYLLGLCVLRGKLDGVFFLPALPAFKPTAKGRHPMACCAQQDEKCGWW